MTAMVTPPPLRAPRCAAASQPSARPLTTTTPARARSAASCSATASPQGDGRREPTIATRGPSGGGHRPRAFRVLRSSGNVVQPVTERLEDVAVRDQLGAFEVGRGSCHAPGPMEATGRESLLLGPALEGPFRARLHRGESAQAAGFELGVEASLACLLTRARRQHALPDRLRGLTARLGGQRSERYAANLDLEVDAVEQRTGQAALISVDYRLRAPAGAHGVAKPSAWARIRGSHQGEPRGVGDRAARPRDRDPPGLERLPERL